MTTIMRSAAVAAVGLFVAFVTSGCDDVGGDGAGPGPTTTTISVTTTTGSTSTSLPVTTTVTTGPTTTTVPVGARECIVTFGVTNAVTLGALQYNTNYSAAPGGFDGAADAVACRDQTGSLASFNDVEATSTLSAGLISIAGFTGPRDIVDCDFTVTGATDPVAGDFTITVVDATDPSLNPVSATVAITDITCMGGGPTTTIGGVTTTTIGGPTTTVGGNAFTIGFNLVDAVTVGALQFAVDYSGAGGGFDGAADTVACTDQTSSLASFNDNEGATTLNAGFINLAGFTGPRLVANCAFTSTGGAPDPADFVVTVQDAAAPNLTPITPLPVVSVTVTAG